VDTIKDFIDQQIINFLRLSATFIFSFIMMYFIHPTYAFYSVCLAPLIFVLSYYFFKKEIAVWEAHEKEADKLNSMVQENLNGIRVVAAFSNQEFEIQRFKKQNEAKMKMGVKQAKLQAYFWPLTDLICNIQIVISVIIGGYFTLQGAISVGELLGFNSYLGMVTMPMRHLGRILSRMGIALVAMERISEIIEKPLEEDLGEIKSGNLSGKIEFKNVSFTYDGKQNVLEDVSFIIPSASQVAIIGESGSGKSTIIKLLLRFYEPTHGEILIDDIPIQKYNKSFLRAQIGSAFQKAFLFSSTIQQNINYTKMDAMEDEIDAAAAVAQAIEMKHKFNKGFNTLVGERGVTLSGGQKQRVALARTILANPTIIVLDDTTSAVDTITEKRILNELDNSLKGKTAIIIANRIASIQKASWIIVLDKGKVAQQGSQKDLLKNSDFYQSIQDIQSHLEEEIQLEIAN
jgi:ATP-binding cassette subfamily B protein